MNIRFSKAVSLGAISINSLCFSAALFAQGLTSGTLTVTPNSSAAPHVAGQLVTMGIPFSRCTVTGADRNNQFKLLDESDAEVAIFVKETLTWPSGSFCGTNSTRALKVQFVFDATGGEKTYSWELTGRTIALDMAEQPVSEVATPNAIKGALMEPRVFVIHTPNYLIQSGLVPPTVAVTADIYDTDYYPSKWAEDARDFNYTTSAAGNWLFDRTSTNYRQAIRAGITDYYREAYLSHEFFMDRLETTGNVGNPLKTPADYCLGGFNMDGKALHYSDVSGAGCDAKYIYTEPVKLHLALTGDDSWIPTGGNVKVTTRDDMWWNMADLVFTGSNRGAPFTYASRVAPEGFSVPYKVTSQFNERKPGFGLQAVLNSCELLLDGTVCGWADTIIDNFYAMQKANPDGHGDFGYLAHSWFRHEGDLPWVGLPDRNYVNATTISVEKVIGDVADVKVGNSISFQVAGPDPQAVITAISTSGVGATEKWTFELDAPISVQANERVRMRAVDPNGLVGPADKNFNYDLQSDRVFSPWMQAIIADGVWQYYNWTEDADQKYKAKELLLGFAHAVATYGIDGTRLNADTKVKIESAFDISILDQGIGNITGCGMTVTPVPRYSANFLMVADNPNLSPEYLQYISPGNTVDQHIPELVFQLSLGVFFETDPAKRDAMKRLLTDSQEWFEKSSCTYSRGPVRSFSWQNKADPYGTYKFVTNYAVNYSTTATFTESPADDGTISNVLNLNIGGAGARFSVTDGSVMPGTHVAVNNVPSGFYAEVRGTGTTTATVALIGTAKPGAHNIANNVNDLEVIFLDPAFVNNPAIRFENSSKLDIAIEYVQGVKGIINYDASEFSESAANDGGSDTVITITLSGDTFTAGPFTNGVEYDVTGAPVGLTPNIARIGDTTVTFSFDGSAVPHRDIDDAAAISIVFRDAAFTTFSAAAVINSTKNSFAFNFDDSTLSYDATTFVESDANDGASPTVLNLTLAGGERFAVAGAMTEGVEFTSSAVPATMSLEIIGTGATATVALKGSADSLTSEIDVSNLRITFLDAAFTGASAASVIGFSRSDITVDFSTATVEVADTPVPQEEPEVVDTPLPQEQPEVVVNPVPQVPEVVVTPVPQVPEVVVTPVPQEPEVVVSPVPQVPEVVVTPAPQEPQVVVTPVPTEPDVVFTPTPLPLSGNYNPTTPLPSAVTNTGPVRKGQELFNPGSIPNLENAGKVVGASLSGTAQNDSGVLEDTELLLGSEVIGGTLRGTLIGSGKVSNALLDIDSIEGDILLGPGTRVTDATVTKVKGLNLGNALLGSEGTIHSEIPLLVDESDGEFSLIDLVTEGIDSFFGDHSTGIIELADDGNVLIQNRALKNSGIAIPVLPLTVFTTANPNGIALDAVGNLVITNRGIEVTYSPASANESAFRKGLSSLHGLLEQTHGGVFKFELGNATHFLRPSLAAVLPLDSNSSSQQFLEIGDDSNETTFEVIGSPDDLANFKLVTRYPDGTSQIFNPYLHDLDSFEQLMSNRLYEYTIDSMTGVLEYYAFSGQSPVFRGIPDYVTTASATGITDISLVSVGDVNGDGVEDMLFTTPDWTQRIYGVSY